MRSISGVGRIAALAASIGAVALVAILLFGETGRGYEVTARFINAGQLVKGNPVQTGGVPIGSVKDIRITEDGLAEADLEVDDEHAPLRRGTRATIRQFSLSGIANRFVDLTFPPAGRATIPDGGRIGSDHTTTAVDLDELFDTLDRPTRAALQRLFKGSAAMLRGRADEANRGLLYLNPALATSSRLFDELTRDTPLLERFLLDSSSLVTDLAERRDDLAGLIGNLNDTTRALGAQKASLAESIERLPPFIRRANTTFVNLRAALDDLDPLVDAAKPVARRLGPFLDQARGLASDAEPTVRDLRLTLRRPGRANDLVELLDSVPPLADIALETRRRALSPGGRRVDVGVVRGAFPETVEALEEATPVIGFARPYTNDLLGWFDDFSTSGAGTDAMGGYARGHISLYENLFGGPVARDQLRRCPGGAEARAADGSNVFTAEEQRQLKCDESDRAVQNYP